MADKKERSVMLTAEAGLVPAPVRPETLVEGLRMLQQRLPGFAPLTITEERSMASVAYLDPEFVDAGLRAAEVWDRSEAVCGMTPEELRAEAEEARRWDHVQREMEALLKGIAGANLKRKHRLGHALLNLYEQLGRVAPRPGEERLRPYLEEMRNAYRKRSGSRKKAKPKE
jgi:hypothetical protein